MYAHTVYSSKYKLIEEVTENLNPLQYFIAVRMLRLCFRSEEIHLLPTASI